MNLVFLACLRRLRKQLVGNYYAFLVYLSTLKIHATLLIETASFKFNCRWKTLSKKSVTLSCTDFPPHFSSCFIVATKVLILTFSQFYALNLNFLTLVKILFHFYTEKTSDYIRVYDRYSLCSVVIQYSQITHSHKSLHRCFFILSMDRR